MNTKCKSLVEFMSSFHSVNKYLLSAFMVQAQNDKYRERAENRMFWFFTVLFAKLSIKTLN